MREVRRVLRPDGLLYLNIGDKRENKTLLGIPWRVVFSMINDGWLLISDNIWSKSNGKPEPVTHRTNHNHEYVFQMAKTTDYFYDAFRVKEKSRDSKNEKIKKRHLRSVWEFAIARYDGKNHYAVFPNNIPEIAIKSGTSLHGVCANCGTQYARNIEKVEQVKIKSSHGRYAKDKDKHHRNDGDRTTQWIYETIGWEKQCDCNTNEIKRPIVLDPFVGTGTTIAVARELDVNVIGMDISKTYIEEDLMEKLSIRKLKSFNKGGGIVDETDYSNLWRS